MRVGEEILVDHHFVERGAQRRHAVGRDILRGQQRAADGGAGRDEFDRGFGGGVGDDVLHQRHVGQFRGTLEAGLQQRDEGAVVDVILVLGAPRVPGFGNEIDLSAQQRERVGGGAVIAADDVERHLGDDL